MGKIARVRVQAKTLNFKLKVVVNFCIESNRRRGKGLKCAVMLPGVFSVSSEGNRMTVLGEGFNPVDLMVLLRKLGYAEIISIDRSPAKKLAEKGLIPEDADLEHNERAFKAVESGNSDRMLCKDSAMTSRNSFSDNAPNFGAESSNNKAELAKLAEEISEQRQEILSLKNTMNQLVALLQQQCQVSQACLPSTIEEEKKNTVAWEDEITEEL